MHGALNIVHDKISLWSPCARRETVDAKACDELVSVSN